MTQVIDPFLARVKQTFEKDNVQPSRYVDFGCPILNEATLGLDEGVFIVAGPPNFGKCLAEGTLVTTADGLLVPIEQLHSRDVVSLDMDSLKMVPTRATRSVSNGKKPCWRVRTSLGHEITATENHPFYTLGGWRELGTISTGDRVAVVGQAAFFGNSDISDDACTVLGLMIGDGHAGQKIGFTTADRSLANALVEAVHRTLGKHNVTTEAKVNNKSSSYNFSAYVGGTKWKSVTQKDIAARAGLSGSSVCRCLNDDIRMSATTRERIKRIAQELGYSDKSRHPEKCGLRTFLAEHDVLGKTAGNKRVPTAVMSAPKGKIVTFLRSLFACDGSAYTLTAGNFGGITYTSKSGGLVRDLQSLLLRFGVVSHIRLRSIKCNGKRCSAWQLDVYERSSVTAFAEEIGILSKDEAVQRFASLPITQRSKNSVINQIPKEIARYICGATEDSVLPDAISTIRTSARNGSRTIHRDRVAMVGRHINDEYLVKLGTSDVVWDRVVEIDYVGNRPVYDIEVPVTHNFVANNFVVHNSAWILNIYNQVLLSNDNVDVLDFSLDDSFDNRIRNSIARIAQTPINWVKLPVNAPEEAKAARREAYRIYGQQTKGGRLNILDGTDLNNRARMLSEIRKKINEARAAMLEDRRLLVVVDGFHDIIVDEIRTPDKNERQAYLSAEMKNIAESTHSIILATAHIPKNNSRRGLDHDAVKGAGETGYDARIIANLYSDLKANRHLAEVSHAAYYPHEPDTLATLPVIEIDIRKNKASSFQDIIFYKFWPETAFCEEAEPEYQEMWKQIVYGKSK